MYSNGEETPFYTQYKRYFSKYRFFSSSKFKKTSQIQLDKTYNFLSKNHPKLLESFINNEETPLYIHLERYILDKLVFEYKTTQYKQTNYNKLYKYIDTQKKSNITSNAIEKDIEKNLKYFQNSVNKKAITLSYDKDTGEIVYINDYKKGNKIDKNSLVNMINGDNYD